MSIDKSGRWWKGSVPEDIDEFLRAYTQDGGVTLDRIVASRSTCGSQEFTLDADRNEGLAQWICAKCGESRFIGDSDEYWAEAKPRRLRCVECRNEVHNLAIGFALRADGEVKWLVVGERCVRCGVLSSFVDWQIKYSPTAHLFEKV